MEQNAYELVFPTSDIGDIHIVSGWAEILQLLAGKDIDGDEMDFGVTMLAGLGSTHFNNFARAVFDDDETVLPQRRTLHRKGKRGASIGALKGVFMLKVNPSARSCSHEQRCPLRTVGIEGGIVNVPAHRCPWQWP